ncbi:MAG: hypothetical protein JEZ07_00935 [Phycisphaerae bacterium]|nr:hypothetical protein [Phycisphaerae bacterium]
MFKKKKRSWPRRILRSLLVSLILSVLLVFVCYMMIVHRPAGYSPIKLTAAQQKAANDKMTRIVTNMHNQLGAAKAFTFTLGKDALNELLLIDTKDDKFLADVQQSIFNFELGSILVEPQVVFDDGAVYLLGKYTVENKFFGEQTMVLSMGCKPAIVDGGSQVKLDILPFKLGALPVAQSMINEAIRRIKLQNSDEQLADDVIKIIKDRSFSFDNRFKSDDAFFSVKDIRILTDRIELDFVPLGK